jgi:hypothetical protein
MWRIDYKGMTLHEVLIMAYMNTVETIPSVPVIGKVGGTAIQPARANVNDRTPALLTLA